MSLFECFPWVLLRLWEMFHICMKLISHALTSCISRAHTSRHVCHCAHRDNLLMWQCTEALCVLALVSSLHPTFSVVHCVYPTVVVQLPNQDGKRKWLADRCCVVVRDRLGFQKTALDPLWLSPAFNNQPHPEACWNARALTISAVMPQSWLMILLRILQYRWCCADNVIL